MGEWCMNHPWMTLVIALSSINSIDSIIKYLTGWHRTDMEVELAVLKELKEE